MNLSKSAILISLVALLFTAIASASPPDLRDRGQLESFSDGVMYASMRNHHVAGAVLSIVADGELLFSKGYGYSDVEKKVSVDPKQTLFRIASITKLLTWTALMQLYEQGKLDLDTDINDYLEGIEIPNTFDDPITIRHLMSHTPGLEDHVVKLFSRDEVDMRPYLDLLNEELPKRVRPAGKLPSYSNHGSALAAVIVEQVSGKAWTDYVDTNILTPLGMTFTSIRQPLPESLAPYLSEGYRFEVGRYKAQSFEFVPLTPAGGGSSTANDIARLMLTFLNGGELDGVRILEPATAELMQQRLYQADPRVSSALHGFYESSRNGQRILGHGGDTIWFHSELMLMPESDVGVFISTNTETGPMVRRDYINAFLERFYPYTSLPAKTNDFKNTALAALVGNYASLRTSFTDFTKFGRLLSTVKVAASEDNQLMLLGFGEPKYFVEIDRDRGLFRRIDQDQTIVFRFDENGNASHLFLGQVPSVAFERVSVLYSPAVQFGLLGLCLLVFLWTLIAWPVQHLSPRWNIPKGLRFFRQIGWLLALVFVLLGVGFAHVLQDPSEVVFGLDALMKVLLVANLTIPMLTLALACQLPAVLRERDLGLGSRVSHITVIVAGVAYSWFLYTWRMLSY